MSALSKLGRRAARVPLILGLALGATALGASAAQANPGPVPWNANYHNFGSASSSYAFVFTNLGAVPLTGVAAPIPHPEFKVTGNTCKVAVAPGGSCQVKVSYTADGQPIADSLQMDFTGPGGRPVTVPAVQLFAGGAQYVYTRHQNGVFTFPAVATADKRTGALARTSRLPAGDLVIWYWVRHGGAIDFPNPNDLPGWVRVMGNTCTAPIEGTTGCAVTLQAAQNTGGQRAGDFQMVFENTQTGASLPVQDVTLVQSAG